MHVNKWHLKQNLSRGQISDAFFFSCPVDSMFQFCCECFCNTLPPPICLHIRCLMMDDNGIDIMMSVYNKEINLHVLCVCCLFCNDFICYSPAFFFFALQGCVSVSVCTFDSVMQFLRPPFWFLSCILPSLESRAFVLFKSVLKMNRFCHSHPVISHLSSCFWNYNTHQPHDITFTFYFLL